MLPVRSLRPPLHPTASHANERTPPDAAPLPVQPGLPTPPPKLQGREDRYLTRHGGVQGGIEDTKEPTPSKCLGSYRCARCHCLALIREYTNHAFAQIAH